MNYPDIKFSLCEYDEKKTPERVKVYCDDYDVLEDAQLHFSYKERNFQYPRFGGSEYRDISAISAAFTIKIGLIFEIIDFYKSRYPNNKIKVSKILKDVIVPGCTKISDKIIQPTGFIDGTDKQFIYRDYQEESIINVEKYGRGLIISPTASGKSIIAYGIVTNYKEYSEKTLIIVPGIQLLSQFYKDFIEYGYNTEDIAMMTANAVRKNTVNYNTKILIVNHEILQKPTNLKLVLNNFKPKAIICDECHKFKPGNKIVKSIISIPTIYRIGMTGTYPDVLNDVWNIKGLFGKEIIKKDITPLQEQNYLAKIRIFPIKLEHLKKPKFKDKTLTLEENLKQEFNKEFKYLEEHNEANKQITTIIDKLKGNTVVLFDHIAYGNALFDLLYTRNKFLVNGNTELNKREDIRKALESNKNDFSIKNVVLGNYKCFGTGINIKNIQNVVICSHGKGTTKIIQGIGRGLRKILEGDEYLNLIDIYHNFKYSAKHFEIRKKLYKKFYNKDSKLFKSIQISSLGRQNNLIEDI